MRQSYICVFCAKNTDSDLISTKVVGFELKALFSTCLFQSYINSRFQLFKIYLIHKVKNIRRNYFLKALLGKKNVFSLLQIRHSENILTV